MTPQVISLSAAGSTAWIPVDYKQNPFNISLAVVLSNTPSLTYKVEYTLDDVFNTTITPTAFSHGPLTGLVATAQSYIKSPVKAVRLTITSWTSGTATLTALQGGVNNVGWQSQEELLDKHTSEHLLMGGSNSNLSRSGQWKNKLLKVLPTQLLIPYDSDDVANFTSSLWGTCTLAQDITRVCPATGLPSVKLTVDPGEVRNNEIRWFNHTPFTMNTNDVFLILIYCPQSISSGWVYMRLRSGTVGNEANYRTIGQSTGYMRQGWNVITLKNTEVVVGAVEYGNLLGTSSNSYNEWITAGTGVDENSTFRSTTLLIGGVGGVDWGIGGIFKAPSNWATASIMFSYDDAFRNFYDIGLPIIESYGWKTTVNITTKQMGDPLYLNMTDIRDLISRGHEIWGHSITHPDFTAVSISEQSRQFEQSRLFWSANGIPSAGKFFAWPQNKYNDETITSAKAAGVKLARGAAGVHFQSWLPGLGGLNLPSLHLEQSNPWHVDATLNGLCLRGQACITYGHEVVAGGSGINSYPAANKHYADHLRRWCDLIASYEADGRAQVCTISEYFRSCGIEPLIDDLSG